MAARGGIAVKEMIFDMLIHIRKIVCQRDRTKEKYPYYSTEGDFVKFGRQPKRSHNLCILDS